MVALDGDIVLEIGELASGLAHCADLVRDRTCQYIYGEGSVCGGLVSHPAGTKSPSDQASNGRSVEPNSGRSSSGGHAGGPSV